MRNRSRWIALIVAAFALGLLFQFGPSPLGVGAATGCNQPAESEVADPWTITDDVIVHCELVRVRSDVEVVDGGRLELDHATFRFEDGGAGNNLTIRSGGALVVGPSSELMATSNGRYEVHVDAGATLEMQGARIADHAGFKVASSDVVLDGTEVRDARAVALTLSSADVRIDDLDIRGGTVGIRATDGTHASFRRLGVAEVDATALHTEPDSRVDVLSTTLVSDGTAATVVGSGVFAADNSSLDAPEQVSLRAHPSGQPRAILSGVPYQPSRLGIEAGRVRISWFVKVNVTPTEEIDLQGSVLTFDNASGVEVVETSLDQDGLTPTLRIPNQTIGPDGDTIEDHNPWTVAVRHGKNVNQTTVEIVSNRATSKNFLSMELPVVPDDVPPRWTREDPLGTQERYPGFSPDRTVSLVWSEAEDPKGENGSGKHAVDYYRVLHDAPDPAPPESMETGKTTIDVDGVVAGEHRFKVRPVDLAGNEGNFSNTVRVTVDPGPPEVSVDLHPVNGTEDAVENVNGSVRLVAEASDGETGLRTLRYRLTDAMSLENYTGPVTIEEEGDYRVTVVGEDLAGGRKRVVRNLTIDRSPPSVTAGLAPPAPTGDGEWYDRPASLSASGADDGPGGLREVRYRIGADASWTPYEGIVPVEANGRHLVQVEALDRAGNRDRAQLSVAVDTRPPSFNISLSESTSPTDWSRSPVTVEVQGEDPVSGVRDRQYRIDDAPWTTFRPPLGFNFSGSQEIQVRLIDGAGNAATRSRIVAIDQTLPVPPQPEWEASPNGSVRLDWSRSPPVDAVSGLRNATVIVAGADGTVRHRLPVRVGEPAQEVGPFPPGQYRFRVDVADRAGNQASGSWFPVNVSESKVGVRFPDSGKIARGRTMVAYEPVAGFTPVEVQLHVDGQLVESRSQPPFTFALDTVSLPDGEHSVRIVATGEDGSQRVQERSFEVRNAYGARVADAGLEIAVSLGLLAVASGLGVWGLREWRGWEPG